MAVCLVGCENSELVTCQQEKQVLQTKIDTLQQNLDGAKSTVTEKDKQIEKLKAKNIEAQNTAMQSITTMMKKQAEADNKLKQKLVERAQQIKELQDKVAALEKQIAEDEKDDDSDNENTDNQ